MFDYSIYTGAPDAELTQTVFDLYIQIFNSRPNDEARERMAYSRDLLALIAYNEDQKAVGFKVGYRQDPDTFYSWLGGVLPEFRGQGIASRLLKVQHDWAREQGYRFIQTKTLNRWREMLLLNIKNGFDITGTYIGKDGRLRIILEKEL